jgi:hypothetical protein
MGNQVLFYIIILVAVILLCFILKILLDIFYSYKSNEWPSVNGTVIKMRDATVLFNNDSMFDITYGYEVNGKEFTSKRIAYGNYTLSSISRKDLKKCLELYPTGKAIKVYYDPNNPMRAVIEKGFNNALLIYLGGLLLMLVFCSIRIWQQTKLF